MDEWQRYERWLSSLPPGQRQAELDRLTPEQRAALETVGGSPSPEGSRIREPRKTWPWVVGCGCLLPLLSVILLSFVIAKSVDDRTDVAQNERVQLDAAGNRDNLEAPPPSDGTVPTADDAGDVASDPEIRELLRAQGPNLYALAWPTAKFESVTVEDIERVDGGTTATIVLRGNRAFDDSELWARVVVTITDGKFVDLQWRGNSPALFPPGSTVSDLRRSLENINRGRGPRDSFFSTPEQDEARRRKWEAFDERMAAKLRKYQESTQHLRRERNQGPLRLSFKTDPGCHVDVAVHFKSIDGKKVTVGWFKADDEDWVELYPANLEIWIYGNATKGQLWAGAPRSPLYLPVIPERGFIYREGETLEGPDLETVPFFELHLTSRLGGEHTFRCSL